MFCWDAKARPRRVSFARDQGETEASDQGECPSWPTGLQARKEGHCFLVVCSSPWPRKEFDWNGDVATRVDCVPQRLNSLRNIYPKG